MQAVGEAEWYIQIIVYFRYSKEIHFTLISYSLFSIFRMHAFSFTGRVSAEFNAFAYYLWLVYSSRSIASVEVYDKE